MTKEQIQERINNALEIELAKIYNELGVDSGDISPWLSLEWDSLTEELATLFQRLVDWNTQED